MSKKIFKAANSIKRFSSNLSSNSILPYSDFWAAGTCCFLLLFYCAAFFFCHKYNTIMSVTFFTLCFVFSPTVLLVSCETLHVSHSGHLFAQETNKNNSQVIYGFLLEIRPDEMKRILLRFIIILIPGWRFSLLEQSIWRISLNTFGKHWN